MDLEIVKIPPDSWQEYKKLRLKALKNDSQAFGSAFEKESAYADEKWQHRLLSTEAGKTWILFAKVGRGLVGMIGGFRNDEDMVNNRVQIWGTYVEKEFRGVGIAKALMAGILTEFSKNHDILTARLEVNIMQPVAKKLYESFGFKQVGTKNMILGDGKEHVVAEMEKKL